MNKPFFISDIVLHSISEGMDRINSGYFLARDIKLLLIELREVANYMATSFKSEQHASHQKLLDFIDLCDFVAHPARDQGVFKRGIVNQMRAIDYGRNFPKDIFMRIPNKGAMKTEDFALSLFGVASFVISTQRRTDIKEGLPQFLTHVPEIALCIMSMLQDSQIDLIEDDERKKPKPWKSEGKATLRLVPYEGKYRIYSLVKIATDPAVNTTNQNKRWDLGFLLLGSDVPCIDPQILALEYETDYPPLFTTFRGEVGTLQLHVL